MMRRSLLAVAVSASLSACLTTDNIRYVPLNHGVMAAFDASHDLVSASTLSVLRQLGVTIERVEELPGGTVIMFSKGMSGFSWGEVGRVIVERRLAPPIPVRLLWVKSYQQQISGTSQAEFAQELYRGIFADLGGR